MMKEPLAEDPTWKTLAGCQITMPLIGLLNLVSRFRGTLVAIIKEEQPVVRINFTNPSQGPAVLHEQNLALQVIIKGTEVP